MNMLHPYQSKKTKANSEEWDIMGNTLEIIAFWTVHGGSSGWW
jgi:hypothetical protein